jgi:hypothetical protein
LNPSKYDFDPLYHKHISTTPPSFMKFCPVVPEICHGISDNVEFLPPIFMLCFGSHFENGRHLENAELLL